MLCRHVASEIDDKALEYVVHLHVELLGGHGSSSRSPRSLSSRVAAVGRRRIVMVPCDPCVELPMDEPLFTDPPPVRHSSRRTIAVTLRR
jgi:hypothetical protein